MDLFENHGALFSNCRAYRYCLWRIWDAAKPKVMFIGLNPSKANEEIDDPTIRRVRNFSRAWGFGGFYMMNLLPFITPYPEALQECRELEKQTNYNLIALTAGKCSKIIFAWGAFKEAEEAAREVEKMFPEAEALIINKDGTPRHPLYVKGDVKPVEFKPKNQK